MEREKIKTDFPEYRPPSEFRGYKKYIDFVKSYNIDFSYAATSHLDNYMNENISGYVIAMTGSDGRFEKAPKSILEPLFIQDGAADVSVYNSIEAAMGNLRSRRPKLVLESIEFRDLNEEKLFCYRGDLKKIFPERILDAFHLFGSEKVLSEAKKKVLKDFYGTYSGTILHAIKSRRRRCKQTAETGKQKFKNKLITHFDVEKGESYINYKTGNASFKYGPLEFVRDSIERDLIVRIRNRKDIRPFDEFPTNTELRINFIHENGLTDLTKNEMSEISECYNYILYEYHEAQHNSKSTGKHATPFNRRHVKKSIRTILKIIDENNTRIIKR